MLRTLWAKITRKGTEAGVYPVQQGTYLDRVTDFIALFPYGMHANLPVGQLCLLIDEKGRIIVGTSCVGRIVVEEGEVVFYHPKTKAKIHFRNSGDIDIDMPGKLNVTSAGDVNVTATNVNIDASVTNLGTGGLPIARAGDPVSVIVSSGSSAGTWAGTITSGGANTSI